MSDPATTRIAIVGAGLAGSLLACMLGRDGYQIDVYERRSDPREKGYRGGRSINLAISERGLHALRQVGLEEVILRHAVRMPGRMIHSPTGELKFQRYSADGKNAINSISRGQLNLVLLEAAARHGNVRFHFDHRCTGLIPEKPELEFLDERRQETVTVRPGAVISTDGAYSAVRSSMEKRERFDYSQSYLAHGYKELHIPPRPDGSWAMEPNALHIWPRGSFMMIALPNEDHSFTCTCFFPFDGSDGFASIRTDEDVVSFFNRMFPDAVALMPTLLEDFRTNPVGSMVTVRCYPWRIEDKVVLVGDAAHAIVPFYGQGANCAFEDCVALAESMRRFPNDRSRAFAEYEVHRKRNADAIADLAVRNFVEMRDHTASRLFHFKKRFEHRLNRMLPNLYLPLYDMVSFTTIPYADARDRARLQWKVVGGVSILIAVVIVFLIVALLRML